jgi:hypothetical protein
VVNTADEQIMLHSTSPQSDGVSRRHITAIPRIASQT